MTTRRAVIGYIRVSTAEQAEHGNGLEAQEKAIRAYAKTHRLWLLTIVSDEGISGSNGLETRVGLAQALARLERGDADALLVSRLDRLARSFVLQETILERLQARGRSVVSVSQEDVGSDDPERVLVRQILGSIGQYEAAVIRGRMAAGKAIKAARGGYVGGKPPYGWRAEGGELVHDDDEQRVVQRIRALRAEGCSYREICRALTAEGITQRNGRPWLPPTVQKVVMRNP